MNRRTLLYLTLGVAIVVIVAVVGFGSRVGPSATKAPHLAHLRAGDAAPPFQVSSTVGFIDSAVVKEPMFLELFATWCPHCRRAVPTLNKIYQEYNKRIVMVAVNASGLGQDEQTAETQADVVKFAQTLLVQYPIAFDPDLTVADKYMLEGYPTIVVIDAKKRVSSITSGEQTLKQLERRINLVLP